MRASFKSSNYFYYLRLVAFTLEGFIPEGNSEIIDWDVLNLFDFFSIICNE